MQMVDTSCIMEMKSYLQITPTYNNKLLYHIFINTRSNNSATNYSSYNKDITYYSGCTWNIKEIGKEKTQHNLRMSP